MTKYSLFLRVNRSLLGDARPSDYLTGAVFSDEYDISPFRMLRKLRDTPQSAKHHPEGDVWAHTMMVVNEAAARRSQSADKPAFMWAALLHDIGKPQTTKIRKDRITAYNHDKEGAKLAVEFLRELNRDSGFIERVALLIKYHMHILYAEKNLPFGDLEQMRREADIDEAVLLALCDRLGRGGAERRLEEEKAQKFKEILMS